jgi:arsenite/tail-anchored protein-transporting ATPase
MLLELAGSRRILFFGGKGGVGKTTVSAATAVAMADSGKRVLLVSTDPAHNLGHLFGREIGPTPVRLAEGLDGLELDPERTVDKHLEEVTAALRRMMPAHLGAEIDKHISLSRDAPGMQEAAMLERIAEVVELKREYDLIVFDTAPSGHTARLMALPEMMSAWTEGLIRQREKADSFSAVLQSLSRDSSVGEKAFGDEPARQDDDRNSRIRRLLNRRKQRFAGLRETIADRRQTAFVIVLAAERLPVLETIELNAQLQRAGVDVAALVVNKRLPEGLQGFLAERKTQEEIHLATLSETLAQIPRKDLTLASHDVLGVDALRAFAADF